MGERGYSDFSDLEGILLDNYRVNSLIKATRKSWLCVAEDIGLERKVALKILKPDVGKDREEQFRQEGCRLAKLGIKHPGIVGVYSSGKDKGLDYLAMELVEGRDLQEILDSGEKFPLSKIVTIIEEIGEAIKCSHGYGVEHNDIKLKNIRIKEDGVSCVVDFGSRLTRDQNSDDLYSIGQIANSLFKSCSDQDIPKKLLEIVDKTQRVGEITPEDFSEAVSRYKIGVVTRRRFMRLGLASAVGLSLFSGFEYIKYTESAQYIVDKIRDTSSEDSLSLNNLFRILGSRISNQKTRWLVESGKIPLGKFPYATSDDGSWINVDNGYWTCGFWPGVLWQGYEASRNDKFKNWALDWVGFMDFTEVDSISINSLSFYYSHARGYDFVRNDNLLDKALKAARLIDGRYNTRWKYLQQHGELRNDGVQEIQIDTLEVIPFLSWVYGKTGNNNIRQIINDHCMTTLKRNLNEDGSTIQVVDFDPSGEQSIKRVKLNGFSEDSCYSRGQARAVTGFVSAYRATENPVFLDVAKKCADYFISSLPSDFVPFYDFHDPNPNIPKDSSAASIALLGLLGLSQITLNHKYKKAFYDVLKSLTVNYLSCDKANQGFLLHGCGSKNKGYNLDSSLIYGDYYFLEILNKI